MQGYALIGHRLGHSLSMDIHRLFFDETGLAGGYDLIELDEDRLPELMSFARRSLDGLNVTIPYKRAVIPFLDELSDTARRVGAVNTIENRDGRLIGHNTDVHGFSALLEFGGISVRDGCAVLLGASGGAARAVMTALLDEGVSRLTLVSRNPNGRRAPDPRCEWVNYAALNDMHADLLVNCTPVGMYPNVHATPVPEAVAAQMGAVVDTIYNPEETMLLRHAKKAGARTVNGLYMLVAQAVRAQEIWQGCAYERALSDHIYERLKEEIK